MFAPPTRIKEAALVLRLPPAELEALVAELRAPSWPEATLAEHVLEPLGIYELTVNEILAIANRRRDQS